MGGGGRGEGKFTKISLGGEGRDIFWKNVIIIKVRCIVYLYSIFYYTNHSLSTASYIVILYNFPDIIIICDCKLINYYTVPRCNLNMSKKHFVF